MPIVLSFLLRRCSAARSVLLLLATAPFAFADLGNRNALPIGDRSAFMANTGVADGSSSMAVLLNPGTLGFVENSKISLSGNRRVHGFAAIRREASTTHAGFALFRRNRLILGSDDETYRPQDIFGNSNSFRYQRLFGELHVEGFEVSHTKDGFRWDDLEEELLQKLRDSLRDGMDLLKQADNYRARPSKSALQPMLSRAGTAMAADLTKFGGDALSIKGSGAGVLSATTGTAPADVFIATETKFSLLVDSQKWNVTVRAAVDPALNEWVRIGKGDNRQLEGMPIRDIIVDVSMAHPFVQQFIGSKNENAELFLRFAVGLALAAEKSARAGYPVTLAMHWFNRLLRESLSGAVD